MRWLILIVLFVAGVGASVFISGHIRKPQNAQTPAAQSRQTAPSPSPAQSLDSTTLQTVFVPAWQLDGRNLSFPDIGFSSGAPQRMVYFGVAVNKDGIDKEDQGYQNLSLFIEKAPSDIRKYLAVRMTDQKANAEILANADSYDTIVQDVISTTKAKGFEGIVVDLEFSPTLNEKLPAQINSFVEKFYNAAHRENLKLAITVYGDTFYRRRPYDIAYLDKVTDEMMIMAYDLHKAGGEPGPNFPLKGKRNFGYDMETLAADIAGVSADKLTIIYGMYGYDWLVDERQRPIRPATSITVAEIDKNFLGECKDLNCLSRRDKEAGENQIEFVDKQAQYHILWYEDMESVQSKAEFWRSRGVGSVAFWAYGYF